MDVKKSSKIDLNSLTPLQLKNNGNRHFFNSNFNEAIKNYSLAISKDSSKSIFYSNRALAYLHLHEYSKVISDCRQAIQIDPNNLKAYFFIGQALIGLDEYDDALKTFLQCHEICLKSKQISWIIEIVDAIKMTKALRFESEDSKSKHNLKKFKLYLEELIKKDFTAGDFTETNQNEKGDKNSEDDNEGLTQKLKELDFIFKNIEQTSKREVPDHLCGRISFEIMTEPVITPSGITYDRKSLLSHLRQVGRFDPLTREPLDETQLIPNLVLKDIIDAFISDNPWAYNY